MLVYTWFILIVTGLLYVDYATNLKVAYRVQKLNINNLAISFALSVIVLFVGFRYEIGYDYKKYLAGFLFDNELNKWEPFFNFLTRFIREVNFGLDSQALFLVLSSITIAILYIAIKKITPYSRTSLILYLLIPSMFLSSFSIVRQSIAMVILLYGLYYLTVGVDKRRYVLFAFLAFMFHFSSVLVALTYLVFGRFFNRSYSWITYLLGVGISFLLYLLHVGKQILVVLPRRFSTYANYEIDVSVLKLLIVNLFFIFLVLQKKQFVKTRLHRYLLNSIFLATIIFNVFADFTYVTRIAQYFLVAEIILVPIYIYSFTNKLKRKIVLGIFLIYYMFNFEYALYRDKHFMGNRANFLIPYKNYWLEDIRSDKENYQQRWIEYWHEIGVLK